MQYSNEGAVLTTDRGVGDYAACIYHTGAFKTVTIASRPPQPKYHRENIGKPGFAGSTIIGLNFKEAFEH